MNVGFQNLEFRIFGYETLTLRHNSIKITLRIAVPSNYTSMALFPFPASVLSSDSRTMELTGLT